MSRNAEYQSMYGSKYLAASDLPEGGALMRARIGRVSPETLTDQNTGKPKPRYVLHFNDIEKAMVVNKTNAQSLAQAYGEFPDAWIGAVVELFTVPTPKGDGVRLRIIKPSVTVSTGTAPAKKPDDELNDAIPPLG
jgi:hypothetical protein